MKLLNNSIRRWLLQLLYSHKISLSKHFPSEWLHSSAFCTGERKGWNVCKLPVQNCRFISLSLLFQHLLLQHREHWEATTTQKLKLSCAVVKSKQKIAFCWYRIIEFSSKHKKAFAPFLLAGSVNRFCSNSCEKPFNVMIYSCKLLAPKEEAFILKGTRKSHYELLFCRFVTPANGIKALIPTHIYTGIWVIERKRWIYFHQFHPK